MTATTSRQETPPLPGPRFWLLTALATLLLGCVSEGRGPAVRLTETWPAAAPGYAEAAQRWTRQTADWDEWVPVIDVIAVLKSTEWRAAYVAERARRHRLPEDAIKKLTLEEQAGARDVWEVEILVSTGKLLWNDFEKGPQSLWRVALVGAGGREVLPLSVSRDQRRLEELRVWFPAITSFHRAYVVRFPKRAGDGAPLVGEGGRLGLKVTSALAGVELSWSSTGEANTPRAGGERRRAAPAWAGSEPPRRRR